jgi:hypothetical protein
VPFTPFHLGPGCALKAIAGNSFSLTVFGFAQVVMDVQPLVHLLRGEGIVHGISHTYFGGTLIAVFSLFVGRPICQLLLRVWVPSPKDRFLVWLHGSAVIRWPPAVSGAFVGAYSHVFLDSMIHPDIQPFAPFAEGNPMERLISFGGLHLLCLGIGLLGILGLVVRYLVESSAS